MPETKEKTYTVVGKGRARVDGPLKVTGRAMYASDHHFPGMLYAVPIGATIGSGKLESVDTSAADKIPGVRAVYHRANIGKLFKVSINDDFSGPGLTKVDENRPPFHAVSGSSGSGAPFISSASEEARTLAPPLSA